MLSRHLRPLFYTLQHSPSCTSTLVKSLQASNGTRFYSSRDKTKSRQLEHKLLKAESYLKPLTHDDWQVIRPRQIQDINPPAEWLTKLDQLQERIGVRFQDITHLQCALIHHGVLPANQIDESQFPHRLSNRSLEFLGDSILGMGVSAYLFQTEPSFQEGDLTHAKKALVNNQTLSKICVHALQMHDLILVPDDFSLGRQSRKPHYQKGRITIQAGAVEALIAAIYLDQGLETCLRFMNDHVIPPAIEYATDEEVWYAGNKLQELLQAYGLGQPEYKQLPAPANSDVYKVTVVVNGDPIATASGGSYKEARHNAASESYNFFSRFLTAPKRS